MSFAAFVVKYPQAEASNLATGLDDYHRLAMHYLFLDYVSFMNEGSERGSALAG